LLLVGDIDLLYAPAVGTQQVSTDFDKQIGANIQRLRKAKGMSQADLARELTTRGFSFQQQGVLRLEGGARPLRLEEGLAIAEIFDVNPAVLVYPAAETAALYAQLLHVLNDIADARQRIAEQQQNLEHFEAVKSDIERSLEKAGAIRGPHGQWWEFIRTEDANGEH
jgi:transcriptional regulator with XRE-family HTH domain